MHPKDAEGIVNSVDPDHRGAVWPGSALFAQTCLPENLGSLRYSKNPKNIWKKCWIYPKASLIIDDLP